ncbi:hypothetical protein GCM10010243_55680 [Streptomyces matensis]|nr:hypothetical protein GCM10010243_55680 [Streptomyces matensis]
MGVQAHLGAEQVRLVAVAGQRGAQHAVAGGLQQRGRPVPAPGVVPRAMDKKISRHRGAFRGGGMGGEAVPFRASVRFRNRLFIVVHPPDLGQ